MMAATVRKPFAVLNLKPCLLITNASIREVVIFDISAGWNFTGPNSNQEWEPFTSLLTNITRISRKSTSRYRTSGTASQKRGFSTKSISTPAAREIPNQRNCFPLRQPRSKMEDGSVECTEAYMLIQPISTRAM